MAAEYGSGGGGGGGARQRRSAGSQAAATSFEEDLHHYMEDPDLDVSSIVTEFVPPEDPLVPYFDATGEEMESEQRVEVARGASAAAEELMDAPDGRGGSPRLLVEQPPSARSSVLDLFMQSISRLVTDAAYARSIDCFDAKIPREISEDALISFLTHCVSHPMRRPRHTLLLARSNPLVLEQVLKTAMDANPEPYDPTMARNSYFRITMKNSVRSLDQLYQIVLGISLGQRGFVDVKYTPVYGCGLAFHGFNGNLPIRMSSPIAHFIQNESDARQHLNALFSTEITLSRCDDAAREVYITYFDYFETNKRTGQSSRVTEVNVFHNIHAAPPPSRPPLHMTTESCMDLMKMLIDDYQPMEEELKDYSLSQCFQLARSYPQHKW